VTRYTVLGWRTQPGLFISLYFKVVDWLGTWATASRALCLAGLRYSWPAWCKQQPNRCAGAGRDELVRAIHPRLRGFEEFCRTGARAIFKYALDHVPSHGADTLYARCAL
jgi:hypothetical protein